LTIMGNDLAAAGTPVQSGTERVIFGEAELETVDAWLDVVVHARLGSRLDHVVFRSGRIDAVFALRLADGRDVVVKVHRPPVDVPALAASQEALRHLVAAGYPCPTPLDGPVTRDGRVFTIESLLSRGHEAEADTPRTRGAMTASLVEHIEILRAMKQLAPRLGRGPAWTRHDCGPWPEPHDTIFDFRTTPPGWQWLDEYARDAAATLARTRDPAGPVIAHGDWWAGNLRFDGDQVVAAFDWDFIVEPEAVAVGLSAGAYLTAGAPTPAQVAAFLVDVETARAAPFSETQRRGAAAAVQWVLAFNARCDLAMLTGDVQPDSALGRLVDDRDGYRRLTW
jgi:Ser/Thr protein kinase RdoA (MazF antagonist)